MNKSDNDWLFTISPKKGLIHLNFHEIWHYRDLIILFVRRDVITLYKQTILGPLWYIIQPLFTSLIFTLIFNNLGQINTGETPPFLFNLAGITAWNYFKECFMGASETFNKNKHIFGKVYFPRVVMPISNTISNLLKFGIQLLIFFGLYVYFVFKGSNLQPSSTIVLFPCYVMMMALTGLGLGMIVSSLTTKYRDLTILVTFGVQLLMYVSAVPYPVSEAKLKFPNWVVPLVEYNPLTQIIEGFRFMLLNSGNFEWIKFGYTAGLSVLIFLIGLIIFNRAEKQFIDTI